VVGPTQPLLLKRLLALLQETPQLSLGRKTALLSPEPLLAPYRSLSLSHHSSSADALQLHVLRAVKAPQETLPEQGVPALQHPTTLLPPKVPAHLP